MLAPRIYADFNNLDDANRLRLTCVGTREDWLVKASSCKRAYA